MRIIWPLSVGTQLHCSQRESHCPNPRKAAGLPNCEAVGDLISSPFPISPPPQFLAAHCLPAHAPGCYPSALGKGMDGITSSRPDAIEGTCGFEHRKGGARSSGDCRCNAQKEKAAEQGGPSLSKRKSKQTGVDLKSETKAPTDHI